MADYFRNLDKRADYKWPGIDHARLHLLALYFPVKNSMSMLNAKGTDAMPVKLLEEIAGVGLDTAGDSLTWGEFYWKNLPPDAKQLYGLSDEAGIAMPDGLKFNLQPTSLNPTDLIIQGIIRSRGASWKDAFSVSVPARRGLNEGFHLLTYLSLLHHMNSGRLSQDASRAEAVDLLLKEGFASSETLLKTLPLQMLSKDLTGASLSLAVAVAGRNSRNGYRCLPVENNQRGSNVIDAMACYLTGNFKSWLEGCCSIRHAAANPPFLTLGGFQLYQVEQDVEIFYLQQCQSVMEVARGVTTGPGMVPFACRLSGPKLVAYGSERLTQEAERDDDEEGVGDGANAGKACDGPAVKKQKTGDADSALKDKKETGDTDSALKAYCNDRRAGNRTAAGTARDQRIASEVVQNLVLIFEDDALHDVMFRFAFGQGHRKRKGTEKFTRGLFNRLRGYDAFEYCCCELDRSLNAPVLRAPKRSSVVEDDLWALFRGHIQSLRDDQIRYLCSRYDHVS